MKKNLTKQVVCGLWIHTVEICQVPHVPMSSRFIGLDAEPFLECAQLAYMIREYYSTKRDGVEEKEKDRERQRVKQRDK